MKNFKNVVVIAVIVVVSVAVYMWLSILRLSYNNALLDLLLNPGFWAFISTACCFLEVRKENKKKVE